MNTAIHVSQSDLHIRTAWQLTHKGQRRVGFLAIGGFLLLFAVQGLFIIVTSSQTVDEAAHLAAGYSYLVTGDFRLDSEHPPLIKTLQALPLFLLHRMPFNPEPELWAEKDAFPIGYNWLYNATLPADQILFLGRVPNLLLGVILVALIGLWSYRLWGVRAASLAVALGALEPTLVAHSSLVTTDTGVTLFIFLTVYLLWEYGNRPSWWLLSATGIAFGFALASKFSGLLLVPIMCAIITAAILTGAGTYILPSRKNPIGFRRRTIEAAALLLSILAVGFFTLSLVYGFKGFTAWISGLQLFWSITEEGRPSFFLGQYSREGWWHYFIVSFIIKTPIGTLLLIAASLLLYCAPTAPNRREPIFLLLPPLVIFALTTQHKVSIGVRYILPVYPFLLVFASRLATVELSRRWLAVAFVGAVVLFTGVSVLRIAPHQLAYFNEFVGGPSQGYRYLSDSNLDWGQDLKRLKAYMAKENLEIVFLSYFGAAPPSYYGIRYQYVPGTWLWKWPPPSDKVPDTARKILAISVYNLQDVASPEDPLFRWLWTRQPVAKIGYSIFVYDLTGDRDGLTKLQETYVRAGINPP